MANSLYDGPIKNTEDDAREYFARCQAKEKLEKKRKKFQKACLKRYIQKKLALPGALTVKENMNFIDSLLSNSYGLTDKRVSYTDRAKRSCIPRYLIRIGKSKVKIYRGKAKQNGCYDIDVETAIHNKFYEIRQILISILRKTSGNGIMLKKGIFDYRGSDITYTIQHFPNESKIKLSYLAFHKKENGGTYLVFRKTYIYNIKLGKLCFVSFERKKGSVIRKVQHGYFRSYDYNHIESIEAFTDIVLKLRLETVKVNVIQERQYLYDYSTLKAFVTYPHLYATFVESLIYCYNVADINDRFGYLVRKCRYLDFYSKFYKKYFVPSGMRQYTSRSMNYYIMYEKLSNIYSYDEILKFFESVSKKLVPMYYNDSLKEILELVKVFCLLIHNGYSKNRLYKILLSIDVVKMDGQIVAPVNEVHDFSLSYFTDINYMYNSIDLITRATIDISRFRNLRDLHDHLAMLTQRKNLVNQEFEYETKVEEFKDGVYTANRVFDRNSLKLLGIRLNNCVGSYYWQIEDKSCEIYYVKEEQEYILAIEVRGKEVHQCKAYGNSILPVGHKYREIAEKVCNFYGFEYTNCIDLPVPIRIEQY